MPCHALWIIENRVMLIRHFGIVTMPDLSGSLKETFEMRDAANSVLGENGPLVHTITDATEADYQNPSLSESQRMTKALRQQRVGWSIFVTPNRLNGFLAGIGHQMAGVRYRSFDSIEKAIDFLKTNDDTLTNVSFPAIETLAEYQK